MKSSPKRPGFPEVHDLLLSILGDDLHAKRVLSLSNGTVGVLEGASLGVRAIGQGLALARGLDPKHAVKQVDRLLSNEGIRIESIFPAWIDHHLQGREHADVLLDWTDFDKDDHTTLMLSLRTDRGRSEPLMWRTHRKSELKGNRNRFEDELLADFADNLPTTCHVTILADRGFADQAFFAFLKTRGFDYIIRLRKSILVESASGEVRAGKGWVHKRGWAQTIPDARLTEQKLLVGSVVTVHAKAMKEPWILACSDREVDSKEAIKRYGRRTVLPFDRGPAIRHAERPHRRTI
jgi:hypothetical protein